MFENLSERFQGVLKKLRGHGRISEGNVEGALNEVRLALLEADVNYKVVKDFVAAVKEKALGAEVLASLSPDQHFIKIVHEEMTRMMGPQAQELNLARKPPVPVMLVGLQGSGKTTTCGKLALYLQKKKRTPFLVPADVYRPAAIEQLKVLGRQLEIPVFDSRPDADPVEICREALKYAELNGYDTVLLDTAGRLHIDAPLMEELSRIKAAVDPGDILLVADAMTGQDAVNQAEGFNKWLDFTGIVLTKMDGDARGGAALSVRSVTGRPIAFAGTGEKTDALEPFHPDRVASRILGMGDVLSLIEKAQQAYKEKAGEQLEKLAKKNQFSLEDFQAQLQQLKKMGSIGELLDLVPGARKLTQKADLGQAEKELKRVEAIINSMTLQERRNPAILNGSRRRRIAQGSGTTVTEINRLIKQFLEMKKMMQRFNKMGARALFNRMPAAFH